MRVRVGLVALLFALAAVGWWWTAGQMQGMDDGPVDEPRRARLVRRRLGRDDGGDDVPVGLADGRALLPDDAGSGPSLSPLLFTAGYLATWTAAGVFAFLIALAGGRIAGDPLSWDRAGRWIAGATLLVAAVYELTPLKDVCLGKCRSPLGFLLGSWRDGRSGALRMGMKNGAWCVGCCWALMASLFALGIMSLVWMAFVAGLIAVEKVFPWRRMATYSTAALLFALGLLLLVAPEVIPALTIPGGMMSPAMS